MKRNFIRLILILATVSIAGITTAQMFWVKQTLVLKEKEFNFTVSEALRNVAVKILEYNKTAVPILNPVKQINDNYFVVKVNDVIEAKLLEGLLKNEFSSKDISNDYEYIIYDCLGKKITQHTKVSTVMNKHSLTANIPSWKYDNYYFGVYFPERNGSIVSRFDIWSFSTIISLIVFVFFAYVIFVVLQQKRLSEVQQDFVNNMTHEFKTPISTIFISSEVLKDPTIVNSPERLLKYATIIQEEAIRLRNQVERVLQMASLEKEEVKLKKEPSDVDSIIKETCSSLYFSGSAEKIKMELRVSPQKLLLDKLHFSNVVFNLLDNAIKYSGDYPQVTVNSSVNKRHAIISFIDNGIGIPEEHRNKIFEKFYRVPQGNLHDVKGFGLGLNYVKLILKAHGGNITMKSRTGQGSIFTIFLPLT